MEARSLVDILLLLIRVDVILLSGDIANMPMKYDLPQEETDKYYKDMEAVINSVSSIQSNMYYIPGNVNMIII